MKHRSVIAFFIVAAALFAAPQLSHDLHSFRSALGSRLRGELLHALLSVPTSGGAAAVAAPRPAETQLASCTKGRPEGRSAKSRKGGRGSSTRAEARTAVGQQLAVMLEPVALSEALEAALSSVDLAPAAAFVEASESSRPAQGEVAMIIPPDSGIDPRGPARALAAPSEARNYAGRSRKLAEEVRVAYAATRSEGKNAEWRMSGEALRRLEEALPGAFEFRVERDGVRARVLKVKRAPCINCPAPRALRLPGQVATAAGPVPAADAPLATAAE